MADYPKWIEPHHSHVVVSQVHTPEFHKNYIDRDQKVWVLVEDEREEEKALAEREV